MRETSNHGERLSGEALAARISDVFSRHAEHGRTLLIKDSVLESFESLVGTMKEKDRNTAMIKIQRTLVTAGGYLQEYTARFSDFMRNLVVSPMIVASEDFPKDKFYQKALAFAESWGDYAKNTTTTATKERNDYRDNFLGSSASGAVIGTLVGGTYGALEGAKVGLFAGGPQGAAAGALIGAAAGGLYGGARTLIMRIKDKMLGPPLMYYSLFTHFSAGPDVKFTLTPRQA